MKWLCKLFGHQPPIYAKPCWGGTGQEYAKVKPGTVDGVGRWHSTVESECPRCGEKFMLCRIHVPKDK